MCPVVCENAYDNYDFRARLGGKVVQLRSTDSPNLVDFADILEICVGCSDFHHFPSNLGGIVKKLYEKNKFHHFLILFT